MAVLGPGIEQRVAHFSGHVQGVGFRYTAARIAEQFNVSGYVENLTDGRVKLVAEGNSAEIDRLVEAIQREMGSNIKGVQITQSSATGQFEGFHIRA